MSKSQVRVASAAKAAGSLSSAQEKQAQVNASTNLQQATLDLRAAATTNNAGSQHQGEKSVQQQYDRIRVLGKGSFGAAIVYRRRADCSLVVLKEIDLSRFKGDRERRSAIQEAQIMSTLNHINIIKYHNAYTTDTKLIIEMEYASVGTLAHFLTFQVDPLEEQEILIVFRQITSGLNYLHSKSIIHSDLKTANIFITIEGLVKIGDFGIAQYITTTAASPSLAAATTTTIAANDDDRGRRRNITNKKPMSTSNNNNSQLGTLAYSSPERCLGQKTDFKSDIWSLGCILYELICSKSLFSGDSLPELVLNITRIHYTPIKRNDISVNLRETFEQMIAREPERRPNARDLLCVTGQLLSRLQLQRRKVLSKRQSNNHHHHGFDLSTEVAMIAANHQHQEELAHINYPHSLVYQVRLDSLHIYVDRVNLPQTKRIKEISKGRSHYLVLTYDNIVYGWGTKHRGQLGACGLTSSYGNQAAYNIGGDSNRPRVSQSARNSISAPSQSSLLSPSNLKQQQQPVVSKQLVTSMLQVAQPTSRPFIINELNHRKIIQVAAGNDFSVFLSKTGIVMTCGDGSTGCLGRGDLTSCFTPCMIESLLNTDVVCIACGPEHVVAVCGNGRAFAWGKNRNGRLGIQTSSSFSSFGINESNSPQQQQQQLQNHRLSMSKFMVRPQPVQLPSDVFIKSAYCGDKSTIFIDSENRCWACGENCFNKLGLDIRRRFKKTLIVDTCSTPTEITSLRKHKIVSCNIGKKHSTFITSEGKLIVFGQDIDHTYRLQSSIICARDSHRRISFELQTSKRRKDGRLAMKQASSMLAPDQSASKRKQESIGTAMSGNQLTMSRAPSYKQLTQSTLINNQLVNFKQTIDGCEDDCCENQSKMARKKKLKSNEYPKYRLSKLQRQQIDSYVRKSRSSKKMPFECVISVSCTPKFTLALTNDNRVYFWGTRSHKKEGFEGLNPLLAPQPSPKSNPIDKQAGHSTRRLRRRRRQCCSCCCEDCLSRKEQRQLAKMITAPKSVEPQLVAGCSDECFVKIGATNNSLMSNIQVLGSDQPIIHAQDPHLIAQSLADLWILDYKPTISSSSSASSASSSSSSNSSSRSSLPPSSPGSPNLSHDSCTSTSASLCSSCLACSGEKYCGQFADLLDADYSKRLDLQYYNDHCIGHDAILEPQPIVSLYVPSMYNHNNGCSLNLVDLFCFDEDRFYLVLDTTLKLQQYNNSRPASASALGPPNAQQKQAPTRLRLGSVNEAMVGSHLRSAARQQQQLDEVASKSRELKTADNETAVTNSAEKQQQLLFGHSASSKPKNSSSMRLPNADSGPASVLINARTLHRSNVVGELAAGISEKVFDFGSHANATAVDTVASSTAPAATVEQQAATPAMIVAEKAGSCEKYRDDNNNIGSSTKSNDNNLVGINDNSSHNASNGLSQSDNNMAPLVCCSSQGGVSLEEPRSLSTFVAPIVGNHHMFVGGPTMRTLDDQTLRPLNFEPRRASSRRVVGSEELVDDASDASAGGGDQLGGIPVLASGASGTAVANQCQQQNQRRRRPNRRQPNKSESTTFTGNIDIDETSSMPSWVRNEFILQQQLQQQQQHPPNSEAGLFVVDCSSEEDTYMSGVSAATEVTLDGNNDDGGGGGEDESATTPTAGHARPRQPASNNSKAGLFAASSAASPHCSSPSSEATQRQLSKLVLGAEAGLAQQPTAKDAAAESVEQAGWSCSRARRLLVSESQSDVSGSPNNNGNDAISQAGDAGGGCSLVRRASSIVVCSPTGTDEPLLAARVKQHEAAYCAAGVSNLLDCDVYRALSGVYRRDSAHLNQQSSDLNSALSSLASSQNLLINNANRNLPGCNGRDSEQLQQQQQLRSRRPKERMAVAGAFSIPEINQPAQLNSFGDIRGDDQNGVGGRGRATSVSQPALNQSSFVSRRNSDSSSSSQSAASSTSEIAAAEQAAATRVKTSSCSSLASLRRSLMKLFC